jgi:putative ABC transport system substrate-binding protein
MRIGNRHSKKARLIRLLVGAMILAVYSSAAAQQRDKIYRIGYLAPGPVEEDFLAGLRDQGYVIGKNLFIEFRQGPERLPELAAELARLNLDCILAVGIGSIRAAKSATTTIPIVMGNASDDPVQHGLVASLARPGGNITGLVDMLPDLAGKRLEILKEIFPKLSRVTHLSARGASPGLAHLKEMETTARSLGIRVRGLEVSGPDALEKAYRAAVEASAEAVIPVGVNFFIPHRKRIIDLQLKYRLPAMHTHASWVPIGGLMSYTTDQAERYRRAATYVDRILQGAKPADLPVERPTKFEFVINLKTAKAIGVAIPPHVLARADRVIR